MGKAIRHPIGMGLVAGLAAFLVIATASCGGSDTPIPTPTERPTSAPTEAPNTPTSPVPDSSPTPTARPTTPPVSPEPTPTPPNGEREIGQFEGVTFIVGEDSQATFTVEEKLARLPLPNDAVVRTNALTGEVHFDGRPSIIQIDLHRLESDQPRRDGYIRDRMFPDHPVATFTLDDAGPLPQGFGEGEEVNARVTGQLDIRGVQAPVTFDVEARDDSAVVFILGRTSFVWSDFGMTAPNLSFVQVTDEVSVEILLAVAAKTGP